MLHEIVIKLHNSHIYRNSELIHQKIMLIAGGLCVNVVTFILNSVMFPRLKGLTFIN
jgi:hypothetical protein